jgi:hypothetical protein
MAAFFILQHTEMEKENHGQVLEQKGDIVKYLAPCLCVKVGREVANGTTPCTTQEGNTIFVEELFVIHMRYAPKHTIQAINALLT